MATIKSYNDLEQSRKLAEILPLESADMTYCAITEDWQINVGLDIAIKENLFSYRNGYTVPCWSLAALLGVIKEQGLVDLRFLQSTYDNRGNRLTNVWCCTFENLGTVSLDLYADNPVDACVDMIIRLHELNLL